MKRQYTITGSKVRGDVQALLQDAEEKKKTNTTEAIKLLLQAGELLPHLPADNDRRSERNMTQDRGVQEILYLSKRGNILYELKDYQEAAACYKAIKDLLPNNTKVYKAIGDCFRKQGDYNEAIKQYEQGLVIYKRDESSMPVEKAGLLNSKGLAYLGLKEYKQALADFEAAIQVNGKNPLYHCNRGHSAYALGETETALGHFKQASELVKSNQLGDLTKHNISYIEKTLKDFIQELEALSKIRLRRGDSIMAARETNFVENSVEALSGTDGVEGDFEGGFEGENFIKDQGTHLRDAKQNLSLILEDQQLYEYYDGFMFTLHQSYATAVVVDSGQLTINTNSKIDMLGIAISLLPLVGTQLSKGINAVKDFVKGAQVTKAASEICSFATTQMQFDEIVQDALCSVILEKEAKLKSLRDEDLDSSLLPNWVSRFQSVVNAINKLGSQEDLSLFGKRNKTPLQKFGYQAASTLVSEYIASGVIYQGTPAVRVPLSEKKTRLTTTTRKVIDDSFEIKEIPKGPETELGDEQNRTGCGQCQTF